MTDEQQRIGRAEQEAAAALLGAHLADGRLAPDEYAQRVDAVLGARTRPDLRAVFADLPPPASGRPVPVAERMAGRLHAELAAEGLLVFEEGLRGSITLHRFRAPGTYANWQRTWMTATLAVTWRRIVVWGQRAKQVDLTFAHPLRAAVTFSTEKPDALRIDSDAGAFHPQRSGRIVYRMRTPSAGIVLGLTGGA